MERNHGTHQDRLIKKMRLKRIATYEQANEYLPSYLIEHNRKFTVAPAGEVDFHDTTPAQSKLEVVFCLVEQRRVSNDWVVRYRNRYLQLEAQPGVAPGAEVLVREWRDGTVRLYAGACELRWAEIQQRPLRPVRQKVAHRVKVMPAVDHPWRSRAVTGKLNPATNLPFPHPRSSRPPPPRQGSPAART